MNTSSTFLNSLFHKLGLIKNLSLKFEGNSTAFVNEFRKVVRPGGLGLFSNFSEAFQSGKELFAGEVKNSTFKIRRRHRAFDSNSTAVVAQGTIRSSKGGVQINSQIQPHRRSFQLFYGFIIPVYALIICGVLWSGEGGQGFATAIGIQGLFLLIAPYFLLRFQLRKFTLELEREFHYINNRIQH